MSINSVLLESIENELIENQKPSYQKIIPIKNYSFETKKTLDYLVEKYGGFINRYDDKIIIFINYSTNKNQQSTPPTFKEERYASIKFEKVNSSINYLNERLESIEEKVSHIIDEQNKNKIYQNKSLESYLQYFRSDVKKKEVKKLIDEIINHH